MQLWRKKNLDLSSSPFLRCSAWSAVRAMRSSSTVKDDMKPLMSGSECRLWNRVAVVTLHSEVKWVWRGKRSTRPITRQLVTSFAARGCIWNRKNSFWTHYRWRIIPLPALPCWRWWRYVTMVTSAKLTSTRVCKFHVCGSEGRGLTWNYLQNLPNVTSSTSL